MKLRNVSGRPLRPVDGGRSIAPGEVVDLNSRRGAVERLIARGYLRQESARGRGRAQSVQAEPDPDPQPLAEEVATRHRAALRDDASDPEPAPEPVSEPTEE